MAGLYSRGILPRDYPTPKIMAYQLLKHSHRWTRFFSALFVVNTLAAETTADNDAAALEPYVNDDTFFAAYLDVLAPEEAKGGDDFSLFAGLPFEDDDSLVPTLLNIEKLIRSTNAVDSVHVVAGLGDVTTQGGPLLVFQVSEGKTAKDVATFLQSIKATKHAAALDIETRVAGENAVLVGKAATLARYAKSEKRDRDDLIGPLRRLSTEGAVFAAVFCPGPDFRRVVRELWPQLPGVLAPLKGDLADKWRHLEVGIATSPGPRPTFALQASDAQSAQTFVELWNKLPMAFEPMTELGDRRHEMKTYLQPIVDQVQPRIEGTRAIVDFNASETQLTAFRKALGDAAHAMTESNRRQRRFRQFKEMTIAMLNYHDTQKQLPASAEFRDKDGKPLLSWRVAILPYLDEIDLYKQFHLDEPWDSPHNRTLISKMPSIYADPDSNLKELRDAGKTTYQVPVAPETVFHGKEGIAYRDIADGTSKTVLIVEVEPLRAVEWTKPRDWEVDMQNPLEGVAREDRKVFTAGFADGHVQAIPVDADPAKLRGLLTRSGQEVFDGP
jgi:hypothetical protein